MPKKPKTRRPRSRFLRALQGHWWAIAGAVVALLSTALIAMFLGGVPLPETAPGAQSTRILAVDGSEIGTLHGDENRQIVPLAQISKHLQEAVISTEDRAFYEHPGVSLRGVLRAVFTNVKGGQVSQGGSTLTQQYVRNAFIQVGRERTIFRKIKEAVVAIKIERKYSKDKILGFYLNTVYFGRGAYGAEAGAKSYFKKSAKDLTLGEAAYLAGVIRSPQSYQPDRNKEGTTRIRDEVLGDMVAAGKIEAPERDAERKQELAFKVGASGVEQQTARAAYFMEYVRRLLTSEEFDIDEKELLGGGLVVHTTLDLRMQDAAEAAVRKVLNKAEDPEVALVAMDPQGNVRAMVGGRNVDDPKAGRGFNYAAAAEGQNNTGRFPGSAYKPVTLAAFTGDGKSAKSKFPAPSEIQIDSKQCRNEDGTPWKVSNFDNEGFGSLEVVEATVKSANTVYAQMMDTIGPKKFVSMAAKLGMEIPSHDFGCALTLGTTQVTPLEMARAYATFAARGKRPDVVVITKILAPDGKMIAERKPRSEETVDENVADTVNFALEENVKRGTGTGAKLGRPVAGKTGTTQNHVDAWFAGYTPELIGIVWMGFPPEGSPPKIKEMTNVRGKRVTGGSFPATIWREFMAEALKGIKGTDFIGPKFTGEVLSPSPTPCPNPTPNQDRSNCAPSPTPSPTATSTPTPPGKPTPSPSTALPKCRPPDPNATPPPPQSPSPSPTCQP